MKKKERIFVKKVLSLMLVFSLLFTTGTLGNFAEGQEGDESFYSKSYDDFSN